MTAAQILAQRQTYGYHKPVQFNTEPRICNGSSTEPYIPPKDTPARGEAALKFKSVPSRGF